MQTFLTETLAKEAKEKLQKKRNLFGLGLTSLIAACSGDAAESARVGGGGEEDGPSGGGSVPDTVVRAARVAPLSSDKSAPPAAGYDEKLTFTDADLLKVEVDLPNGRDTFTFNSLTGDKYTNANLKDANAETYQLDDNNTGDVVIGSPTFSGAFGARSTLTGRGKILIYWDITEGYYTADGVHTEIYSNSADDKIGTHAPDFLHLDGDKKYDIVIRSQHVDNGSGGDVGAYYIIWDISTYKGAARTPIRVVLGNPTNANPTEGISSGSISIFGESASDPIGQHEAQFLKLNSGDKHDMVIRSQNNAGAIYTIWDVADYTGNKIIDLGKLGQDETPNLNATAGSLTIKGATAGDAIGKSEPVFAHLDSNPKYDMVIISGSVDKPAVGSGVIENTGAIYILWDVADYTTGRVTNKTINLGRLGDTEMDLKANVGASFGSLAIYGAKKDDKIGAEAPEFLHLDGDTKYDMVIRSHEVYGDGGNTLDNAGAIYILWDVADYAGKNKTIDLGTLKDGTVNPVLNVGAFSGSLAIHGAKKDDKIGAEAPEFLHIDSNPKYDMVIRSGQVNKTGEEETSQIDKNEGAIYILWDIDQYANGGTETVTLGNDAHDMLSIYGAKLTDQIGLYLPKFLKIGGKDGYDMVIEAPNVNNGGTNIVGAVYILWDVADYNLANGAGKTIDLGATSGSEFASSGLLTVYGDNITNGLLGTGNTALKHVEKSGSDEFMDFTGEGTEDIVLKGKNHYYVLFGEKVALTTGAGDNEKVTSKTIDLKNVSEAFDGTKDADQGGFFFYDFDNHSVDINIRSQKSDSVGYRFSKTYNYTDIDELKTDFDNAGGGTPAGLSNTDADLGVWDIA